MSDPFGLRRKAMVDTQIRRRGIQDERVLSCMEEVHRHLFVPSGMEEDAYLDRPLPIGHGQTISQPYIVARMTELLELEPDDLVLEIGCGSGYQAALLAKLAGAVISIERIEAVAQNAEENLRKAGISGVRVIIGDGTTGFPDGAPYNAILLTAATPEVPSPLLSQMAEGGRLVAPVGDADIQYLVRIRRQGENYLRESFEPVRFVPLIGRYGWSER